MLEGKIKNKELTLVTKTEFKRLARSKREMYNLLKYGLKIYLPDYHLIPMKFLK